MSLRLNGSTSGYSELEAPAVAGDLTFTLPSSQGSANNLLKNSGTAGTLEFASNVNIDSSNRLLVGTSTARSNTFNGSVSQQFQIEGTTDTGRGAAIFSSASSGGAPAYLILGHQKSGTIGGNTALANGDEIGLISFQGSDGTEFVDGARIAAVVDGTSGANDLPTRLVLSTTADGSSSPLEVMRLTSARTVEFVGAGGTSGKPAGVIAPIGYVGRSGTSGSFANVFNIFWNGSAARLYIDTSDLGTISTSSDYRIKQNVQTQTQPAIERIKLLRPVTYELKDYGELFKADGITREGFIAHEVQEVIPSGAEGAKDEENRIQNLRVDAIVSVLTKALQEAIGRIETLEASNADLVARITALEAAS